MAEAVVLLVAARAVPPSATVGSLASELGLTQAEMRSALDRVRARTITVTRTRLVRPDRIPDGMKWCPWAGHVVARSEFTRNRSRADGLAIHCRACTREHRLAVRNGTLTRRPCPTNPERAGVREVRPVANAAQHGTRSMYVRGCGCEPCREAQRVYSREQYARKKAKRLAS